MARIAKWGNSHAVRLPAALMRELSVGNGDEVSLTARKDGSLEVARDDRRETAIAALRALQWKLPADYRFDREEISRRGRGD